MNDFDKRQAHWFLEHKHTPGEGKRYPCSQSGTIVDRAARREFDAWVESDMFLPAVLIHEEPK